MRAIEVTTPCGKSGDWAIEAFTISAMSARMFNITKPAHMHVAPGSYKRLVHRTRGVIMSNTPMEVLTNLPILRAAKGHVLINGLGLGMILCAMLDNPKVKLVTVVEINEDVIALTAPHFQKYIDAGIQRIVQGDCFTFRPPKDTQYDCVWHDIWDDISDDNLGEMQKLKRKYQNRAKWQGCWAEDQCREQRNRMEALCATQGKTLAQVEREMASKGLSLGATPKQKRTP